MEKLKYILLLISFLSLIIEKFIRNTKEEKPLYKKYSFGGWLIFSLTVLAFLFGIYKTYNEDQTEYIAKEIANQKRKDDSILLLRRWEYDTLKFKELLDSSKIVISNSLVSIEKGNKNLYMSESLLKAAEFQGISINKNLLLTNKLSFALPSSIGFQFHAQIKLSPTEDSSLIAYLDSLTNDKDNEIYFRSGSLSKFKIPRRVSAVAKCAGLQDPPLLQQGA